jgi:folate-binding protein YgfZ
MTSVAPELFIVERVPRAVFSVIGERPLGYLHDVLAQDVAELTPGRGAIAAVLTANGRLAGEVRVLPMDEAVLLDAEEAARPGIIEQIARHAPLAGVDVTDVGDRFVLAALRGVGGEAVLAAGGLPVPGDDEASIEREGDLLFVRVAWGGPGVDLLGPPETVAAALARIDVRRSGLAELDAARIAAQRPRYGADVTEELLVNETPLLVHGVSMSKGCYPGQESVARIHNLGRVRRAVRGLRSSEPLTSGGEVLVDGGTSVGRVTSAAGSGVAIALLAAEIPAGTLVRIGGVEAVVEVLT